MSIKTRDGIHGLMLMTVCFPEQDLTGSTVLYTISVDLRNGLITPVSFSDHTLETLQFYQDV